LQHSRKRDPEEVWNVGIDDPSEAWGAGFNVISERGAVESKERPDESGEDEEDADGREEIVFEGKLKIAKGEIENKVQCKRQCNYQGKLLCVDLIKHSSIRHRNDGIQHCPHRPKEEARWRPRGLYKGAVPVIRVGAHKIHYTNQRKRAPLLRRWNPLT